MLVRTGLFCPHAHSLLIFAHPILPARVFTDAFTVLSMGIGPVGLAVPNSNIGIAVFGFSFWVAREDMVSIIWLVFIIYEHI